jgi:hypothetical protein
MRSWIWRSSWVVLMGVIEPRRGCGRKGGAAGGGVEKEAAARWIRGSSDGPAGALCPEVPRMRPYRRPLDSARFP